MVFKPGHGKEGGRKAGSLNKRTVEQKAVEAQLLEAWNSQVPGKLPGILDAALSAAQEGDFDPLGRLLPYIARKMPDELKIDSVPRGIEAKDYFIKLAEALNAIRKPA